MKTVVLVRFRLVKSYIRNVELMELYDIYSYKSVCLCIKMIILVSLPNIGFYSRLSVNKIEVNWM